MGLGSNASFEYKSSFIHNLNPITKLFGAVWVVLFSAFVQQNIVLVGLFMIIIIISFLGKCFITIIKLFFILLFPAFVFIIFAQGFFNPSNQNIVWNTVVLGYQLNLGQEGLDISFNLVSKLLVITPAIFIFVITTSPEYLMSSLIQRGISPFVSYIFLATLNIVPHMRSKITTIKTAQEARGLCTKGNFKSRLNAFFPILMPLIFSALMDIQAKGMTLEVRSFGSNKNISTIYDIKDSWLDKLIRIFLIISIIIVILYRLFL